MNKSKLKNNLTSILTTKQIKIGGKTIIPKLKIYDNVKDLIILGMPRELTKHQIEMILQITNGVDYKLVIQRDNEKHMMMIQKSDKIRRDGN